MHLLTVEEKNKIIKQLSEEFGIEKISENIVQFGAERYRIFSGNLTREECIQLDKHIRIESIGLYTARQIKKNNLRLTIDGAHYLKEKIKKNFFEISLEDMKKWLSGNDLNIVAPKGFLIIRHTSYILGCGKSNGKSILNSVPKERRIRN